MTVLLMCVHIYFTFKLKFVQKHTFRGIAYSLHSGSAKDGIGTYKAFAASLGTTLGPGNIIGVAVAISVGGCGAVFWMWLSGVLAMSTRYAESFLALKYRKKAGGTATLCKYLGYNKLATLWSVFCAAGGLFMGAAIPSNSLATTSPAKPFVIGLLLAFLTVLTVLTGFNGIANVSALAVPVMSIGFTVFCLAVTAVNCKNIPSVLCEMMKNAFLPEAPVSAGLGIAVREGIKRGLYSNESGLGTGSVLAAESGDENTELSALAAMTTTFWDTVVMCAVTGIMFLSCGAKKGMSVPSILDSAFSVFSFGKGFLSVSMWIFVYATIIGWYYIAKRTVENCFSDTHFYDALYVFFVFFGSVCNLSSLIKISDIINFCLLLPSLFVILKMRSKIRLYRRKY